MNANKKAKSVLAALLAGMMIFASACNQETTGSSEPAGDSSAAGESSQGESTEKSHIVFWDMAWGGPDTYVPAMEEVLTKVNAEFADQLDGDIEYVNLPWDNFLSGSLNCRQQRHRA